MRKGNVNIRAEGRVDMGQSQLGQKTIPEDTIGRENKPAIKIVIAPPG